MKILVTGGSGLVGTSIKKISNDYNYYDFIFLASKDCDLTNYEETHKLFEKEQPDFVIHLAACVGGIFLNMKHKVNILEKNLLMNYNVVKCSHIFKVKKLIACLSTCIFPDKTTYPIDETMLHDGPPAETHYTYAYTKRLLEIHCKAYFENYGDNFICIIPTNIYGINDNYSLEDGHVLPALIHRCYLAKQNREKFIVKGSGSALRQFIYAEDLARLLLLTLEKYNEKTPLILSVDENTEYSIEYIAKLIAKYFDYENNIEFDSKYSDGQLKKTACNKKLIKYLGDYKFVGIEDGIKTSVEWFINNYEFARK
jgi:GDP-L-fucose synthase